MVAVAEKEVDLVITDVNMPNIDGITLVSMLRAREKTRSTPVLLITTEMSAERQVEATERGATDWINKPFDMKKILTIIEDLLDEAP